MDDNPIQGANFILDNNLQENNVEDQIQGALNYINKKNKEKKNEELIIQQQTSMPNPSQTRTKVEAADSYQYLISKSTDQHQNINNANIQIQSLKEENTFLGGEDNSIVRQVNEDNNLNKSMYSKIKISRSTVNIRKPCIAQVYSYANIVRNKVHNMRMQKVEIIKSAQIIFQQNPCILSPRVIRKKETNRGKIIQTDQNQEVKFKMGNYPESQPDSMINQANEANLLNANSHYDSKSSKQKLTRIQIEESDKVQSQFISTEEMKSDILAIQLGEMRSDCDDDQFQFILKPHLNQGCVEKSRLKALGMQ
jgi:hypothetical protein